MHKTVRFFIKWYRGVLVLSFFLSFFFLLRLLLSLFNFYSFTFFLSILFTFLHFGFSYFLWFLPSFFHPFHFSLSLSFFLSSLILDHRIIVRSCFELVRYLKIGFKFSNAIPYQTQTILFFLFGQSKRTWSLEAFFMTFMTI